MNRAVLSVVAWGLPSVLAVAFATTGATKPTSVELQGVSWYSDPVEASRAAARLGRPLLTLQMMGRLDDDFC